MKRNIIKTSKAEGGIRFEITSRYLYQFNGLGKRFRRVRLKDLHIALGYSNGWFVTGQEHVWHLGGRLPDSQGSEGQAKDRRQLVPLNSVPTYHCATGVPVRHCEHWRATNMTLSGNKYSAREDRAGNVLITRKSDGASVYLQGDDAVEFLDNHRILGATEYPSGPFQTSKEHVDACLSEYDEVLEVRL